jgi:hypothetical protein
MDFAGKEGFMRTYLDAKAMAKAMRAALADHELEISHSDALEIVARQFGCTDWNVLSAKIAKGKSTQPDGQPTPATDAVEFKLAVPVLRIFDLAKAEEFYLEYLGFTVEWTHRFEESFPVHMQIARGNIRLQLTEHTGEASPGSCAVVYTSQLAAFLAELKAKDYRYFNPAIEKQEWGLELKLNDPFSNRLRFIERSEEN